MELMLLTRFKFKYERSSSIAVVAVNVLVAVAEAEAEAEAVNVPVAVAVAEAVLVAMISRRRLFCFDFGIKKSLWLPRCCCFEKETGEGKWMALIRDLFFYFFSLN